MTYFDKYKRDMFPDIKDWTLDPMEHIIHYGSIGNMPYRYWVFFHPSAYTLVTYSFKICSLVLFGGLAAYAALKQLWLMAAIAGVVSIYQIPQLFKQIKNQRYFKDYTFYDLWMRE